MLVASGGHCWFLAAVLEDGYLGHFSSLVVLGDKTVDWLFGGIWFVLVHLVLVTSVSIFLFWFGVIWCDLCGLVLSDLVWFCCVIWCDLV